VKIRILDGVTLVGAEGRSLPLSVHMELRENFSSGVAAMHNMVRFAVGRGDFVGFHR
jgi:hypothetical protein